LGDDGTAGLGAGCLRNGINAEFVMKGLILWIMGVPISVIILLYIFVFN
jgi:hypothetical protein